MAGPPVPVLVGVGQAVHRDDAEPAGAEPLGLILAAARAAGDDAGARVLGAVDTVEVMAVGSWHYDDLPGAVAAALGLDVPAARRARHPTGGETPLRALDVAATRIAAGRSRACLLAGAEGTRAATRARRAGDVLPWTPAITAAPAPEYLAGLTGAFRAGISRAMHAFPMYDNALRAHEGRTLAEGQVESGRLWAALSRVAAANPYAWSRDPLYADTITTPAPHNRPVSFPYTKLQVANPFVNQGAALLLVDRALARELGVPEDRWVYPLGGAGADEPADPRARVAYFRNPALEATVRGARRVTGTDDVAYDAVELYSCFPAMPKLTARALGDPAIVEPSVTGGLSFFGGPGSNYMTHALAAMVGRLRGRGGTGFLHGVGMFNTKHHAVVLSTEPRPDGRYPAAPDAVGDLRPPLEGPVPVAEGYTGPGTVVTYSVTYGRHGEPAQGAVVGRGPGGERFAAPVADPATLAALTSGEEPIGLTGTVGGGDPPEFRL